jgi:hypothetical protein
VTNDVADDPKRSHRLWARRVLLLSCVAALVLAGFVTVTGKPFSRDDVRDAFTSVAARVGLADPDTDGDGLTDQTERDGWKTKSGDFLRTDPRKADTDGDGLPDGFEAGGLVSNSNSTAVYKGVSDPRKADSDSDGVGDADELFLALNPLNADTDGDRANDAAELDCGSDPAEANPDGDSYSDTAECERGSDPLTYDLGHVQAVTALLGGAGFGDATWAAEHLGRLNDAQLESPEYLAGQIASSFIGITAIRDFVADIGQGDIVSALLNATALIPLAGGAAAALVIIVKFAKRGERAEQAALDVIRRAPWPKRIKDAAYTKLFGTSVRLPAQLRRGAMATKGYSVYRSGPDDAEKYVGISKDLLRRTKQHAANQRGFDPKPIEGATNLTRGQAHAIEEACIVQGGLASAGGSLANRIHSISPNAPYRDEALKWAVDFMAKHRAKCPVPAAA